MAIIKQTILGRWVDNTTHLLKMHGNQQDPTYMMAVDSIRPKDEPMVCVNTGHEIWQNHMHFYECNARVPQEIELLDGDVRSD